MLDVNEFDSMKIGIASPEKILEWSHGEVTKPETINYRTLKAETDGLFCEKIFGPTKDWECKCGKYKRMRYKGTVCDKCGVEVTSSKVRRERMGHISLACPVSHIWYFKGIPSRIGLILSISPRALERVLYFAAYIVLDPGTTNLTKQQILTEAEYQETVQKYGYDSFKAGMGAEAIQTLLKELDLKKLEAELKEDLKTATGQRRVRSIRRLEEVESFIQSGNKPEWMIMTVIPVIPPDLRPMVQLDGGRFATSDLNDLYRRVINRNNRLKRLLELGAPEIIIRNEKRMLQEAVDALIDNGRRGRAVTGPGNRPLKSLSDMLKGKQGRFRQNLLGKRVDYSGRSVIVVGPELKMYQCGLPKEMAVELFKPFIMHELIARGMANNLKVARKKVDKLAPEVWDVLADVIKEHPVLLNRAPTLHRLGIQAFEPILWEGRAIKLHPLVCPGYNADFDGDQMACHLPLSVEAQAEARTLMLSINNILSTKDGKPVAIPSQDMILGSYYLTITPEDEETVEFDKLPAYTGYDEIMLAYDLAKDEKRGGDFLQHFIRVDIPGHGLVITTPGRVIFNYAIPEVLRFFHKRGDGRECLGVVIDKKQMGKLVNNCFRKLGFKATGDLLDSIKALGFHYALVSGISIGINDVAVPANKNEIIAEKDAEVERVKNFFRRGLITNAERYKKVVEIWTKATDEVGEAMKESMKKFNPLTMMAQSGARGNDSQMRQLAGMRGLIADTSGRPVELPVKANYREGLTVLDYFTSSHGARKGLADTALRTADSGYLTRRLVDVSQDVIVREEDCDIVVLDFDRERVRMASTVRHTINGLKPKLLGAMLDEDVLDPKSGDVLLVKGRTLTSDDITLLNHRLIHEVTIIPMYQDGAETPAAETIDLGAKAADEELTASLRHFMNTRLRGKHLDEAAADRSGCELFPAGTEITGEVADAILAADVPSIRVHMDEVEGVEVTPIIQSGGVIETLADRITGRCPVDDVINPETGELIAKKNEEITEEQAEEIQKHFNSLKIRSILTCHSAHGICAKCYGRNLATGRHVEIGEAVGIIAAQSIGEPGTQLTMRTFHTGGTVSNEDITQGLPRVEELFEARKPKGHAIISEIGGTVTVSESEENKGVPIVTVTNEETSEQYKLPFGKRAIVKDGDVIEPGTKLMDGSINPHDILRVKGVQATQQYIVSEVQSVYRSQGVEINDKHIEIIVRQMLRKIKIEEPGDSEWLPGETVDMVAYRQENQRLEDEGKEKAVGRNMLLGTTKAALATDSFLSAASFQETTRVLTEAAIKGKSDPLIGLKENVIIGKLIPAGTGMSRYRRIKVIHEGEPKPAAEEQQAQ